MTITVEQRTTEAKADGSVHQSFVAATLQFFDLAGSERVMVDPLRWGSGRKGLCHGNLSVLFTLIVHDSLLSHVATVVLILGRLAESVSIHKAQATFSSVVSMLADGRKSHVPFGDSTVTRLMKV
jgi:hypothetical protein